MILYYKPTCPFCVKVLEFAKSAGIGLELLDITESDAIADELVARGGKRQVPYLVDQVAGIEMYESDAIIAYLQQAHGN